MYYKSFMVLTISISAAFAARTSNTEDIWGVINDILERLDEKESLISHLEGLVTSQQKKIETLERELAEHRELIQDLDSPPETIGHLSQQDNEKTFGDNKTDTNERSPAISKQRNHNRIRQVENESAVAFLASRTSHMQNVGAMQNIAFDRLITNIGNAYNPHAGVFIAPVSGIYVFSTTILSFGTATAHFSLLQNGAMVTRIYHNPGSDGYETASLTAVLQLAKGDDVSVANVDADNTVHGSNFSSFTGFLLQEIFEEAVDLVGK